MFLVTIFAFIVALNRKKHNRNLLPIFNYIILSLAIDLSTIYLFFFSTPSSLTINISKFLTLIFVLGEFGFLMGFLIMNLANKLRRRFARTILIQFYLWIFILPLFKLSEERCYVLYSSIDSTCLILGSMMYFYELFQQSNVIDLKNSPSFWISIAILFYAACSLPIYIFQNFMLREIPQYYYVVISINYLLYCLVHLVFIRAYLCTNSNSKFYVCK
jgi:hypothetical protein